MQGLGNKETPLSQKRVRPAALSVTALAVSVLIYPSLAQSDPVEMTVGNYTVVYMQDKSDLRWNFTEAQEYCQQRFGTSLASFHTIGSFREVGSAIENARDGDQSSMSVEYRFGLHCEREFTPEYGGYTGQRLLRLWEYSDGTRFDYGLGSEGIRNRDIGLGGCPSSLVIQHLPQETEPWDLIALISRTSGMICNAISDEDWRSENQPRTEFIICDDKNDCTLDCNQPPQCQYYRNTGISGMKSLFIRSRSNFAAYGTQIAVSNVDSVIVESNWVVLRGAFEGSLLAFSNCREVSVISYTQTSLRATILWFDSIHRVSVRSGYSSGIAMSVIAKNITSEVSVNCPVLTSCRNGFFEFMDCLSVTHQCQSCVSNDYQFRRVRNVNFTCDRIDNEFQRGCFNSRLDINGSELENPSSVMIACMNEDGCDAESWIVDGYDSVSIHCQSENSCEFGSPMETIFTNIMKLTVNCEASHSCNHLWTAQQPLNVTIYDTLHLWCHVSQSCFFDDTVLFLGDAEFDFIIQLTEPDSLDMKILLSNKTDVWTRLTDDRKLLVICEGIRSCVDFESKVDLVKSFIAEMSEHSVSITVECNGRESCVQTDFPILGESSAMVLFCNGQRSCDSARVIGYCSWKMGVTLLSDVEDMTVICPADLSKGECKVSVNSGKLRRSRIGMSDSDWDSSKFSLEGQSDAFVQVTSLHLDSDEQDSCEEAGSASQAECFLVFNGNRRWVESLSCSNFVMSLYSPMTILVGSLTTLFGVLFLISAINQKDSHNRGTFNQINSERIMWLRNVMSVMVALLAFTALICSCILIAHQNKASEQGSDGSFSPISPGFYLMCSLNAVCFVGFISCLEVWLVLSNRDGWNPLYSRIRDYFKLNDQSDLRTLIVALIALRNSQMVLFYCFSDWSAVAAGVLCVTVDLLMVIPSRVSIVCIYCLFVWFLLSQYSPLPLAANNQSFFQVITNGTDDESAQVWFDLLSMGMLFSVGCLIITAHSRSHITKEQSMFLQFFDLATDLTVLAYWLSNGLWLWASIQSVILVSTCVIQWSVLRDDLHHWKEHLMIVTGLGRGYTKIRLWFGKDDRWLSIDRRCSLLETFYESAPSVMFGLYAFLSDVWESHLSGNSLTGVSNDVGPLLISMLITGMAIAFKSIVYTLSLRIPRRLKIALFFFTLSDFVVRILPLAVLFALLQSDSDNDTVSLGLMVGFPLILLVLLAEQSAVIYHCTIHEHTWQRLSVMYALPLSLTSSPILFHSLQTPGLPLYFDFHVFLKSHLMVAFQSVMVILLCIAVEPTCFVVFLSVMITFFSCLIINLFCIPFMWQIGIEI